MVSILLLRLALSIMISHIKAALVSAYPQYSGGEL